MNRFRFRLQRLLDVKSTIEAMCQQELVQCDSRLQEAKAQSQRIRQRIDELCLQMCEVRTGELDLFKEQMLADFLSGLRHQLVLANERVEACQVALKQAREQLVRATQERKSLEKLREADWLRYRGEQARREQVIMDEIAQRWSHHA